MKLNMRHLLWIGGALLVIATIILYQIPHAMEVTLHLLTERLSFALAGTEDTVPVLEGLPLTSLKVTGFSALSFEVNALHQQGRSLATPGSRLVVHALHEGAQLAFSALDELSLSRLVLASNAHIVLYTDQARQLLMRVENPQVSEMALDVVGTFSLTLKDVVLRDEVTGTPVPLASTQPVQTVEVVPSYRNLILEQEAGRAFSLVMRVSAQIAQGQHWPMALPFTPRLKVDHLDFTRKERDKALTTIHELWIDPLVPEQAPKKAVYLEVKDEEVFTLQTVHLTEKGLMSELTATTDTLWMGKEKPFPNIMPSLLVYLVEHKVFKTVCQPLGLC